mgnify:CR=1 FL=1|jgi:2-oxoglutarate ferredoxin oxidoreductase subunit delta
MEFWRKPLDLETVRKNESRIVIIEERCKGCEFCIEYCPRRVLVMSSRFNVKGYHFPEVEDASQCVSCRFCEALCPEFAIFVTEQPDA